MSTNFQYKKQEQKQDSILHHLLNTGKLRSILSIAGIYEDSILNVIDIPKDVLSFFEDINLYKSNPYTLKEIFLINEYLDNLTAIDYNTISFINGLYSYNKNAFTHAIKIFDCWNDSFFNANKDFIYQKLKIKHMNEVKEQIKQIPELIFTRFSKRIERLEAEYFWDIRILLNEKDVNIYKENSLFQIVYKNEKGETEYRNRAVSMTKNICPFFLHDIDISLCHLALGTEMSDEGKNGAIEILKDFYKPILSKRNLDVSAVKFIGIFLKNIKIK